MISVTHIQLLTSQTKHTKGNAELFHTYFGSGFLNFNMVGNIMGSFDNKSDSYKRMKLSYPENYEISPSDVTVPNGNSKAGYVKAGVLFYFDTDKLNYQVIGHVNVSVFNNLIHYIENLSSVEHVIDNLKEE